MENKSDNNIKIPSLIRNNPVTAAILSKLNKDQTIQQIRPIDSNAQAIAMSVNEKIRSNDDIVQLFPDVELSIQILTSSIISPNDMLSSKLSYKSPNVKLPSVIKNSIMQEIETHIEKYYGINDKLQLILREAMFTKGAYIEAIVPEASLDDIVSQWKTAKGVSLENYVSTSIKPTYDFLGNGTFSIDISLEENGFTVNLNPINSTGSNSGITQEDLGVELTDNHKVMSIQRSLIKNAKVSSRNKLGINSISTEEEHDLDKWFKPSGNFQFSDTVSITTGNDASRKSFGKPLVVKLPTESVIPVHVTNAPEKHLGYFVLLDDNGTPLVEGSGLPGPDTEYYDFVSVNNDNKLNLIEKAKSALFGLTKKEPTLNNIEEMYGRMVESLIKSKLKTGMFGGLVDIKDNYDLYRVMFHRALKNQRTKLLFLPSELVAFYAFDYRDNGTGKSLLEKTSILYSIRAILLFSRIMAYLKNSTVITEVTTEIDEKDPNPDTTMEKVKSEALKTRQAALPLGITNVNDLQEWCSMSGIRFKFRHPGLPNTDISMSDLSTSKTIPDDELDRIIKDYVTMSFGLTPEIVESGYNSDFATTVTAKNLLLAKRTTQIQNTFVAMITDHIRKILQNDEVIKNNIKEIIKSNIKDIKKFVKNETDEENKIDLNKISQAKLIDYVVVKFINEIEVSLPKPELQQANNIKEAFDNYKSTLDDLMDILMSTEAIPSEYAGDISNHIDNLKSMFKAVLLKTWVAENNYIPELSQFLTKNEEGKPTFNILDEYVDFLDSISEAFIPFIKQRYKSVNKLNNKINKATEGSSGGGYDSGDDYGDDDDDGGSDDLDSAENNDNDDNNDDDFGDMDDDFDDSDNDLDDMGDNNDDDFGDMDDDFGDSDNGSSSGPKETETDRKLKEAKMKVEEARAKKYEADTKLQEAKTQEIMDAGNDNNSADLDNVVMDDNNSDVNPSRNDSGVLDDGSITDTGKENEVPEQKTENESKIEVPNIKRPFTSNLDQFR